MSFSDTILGKDGLISRKLDGYEDRPQQLKMANAVEDALNGEKHLVVEAGTGVGKSFAYLVPAIKRAIELDPSDRPIVISTGTIALQEQLFTKDIPFLQSIWEEEFTAVLAKGRGNYISLRRLERAAGKGGGAINDETRELLRIQKWSEDTPDGTLSSIPFQPSREVWQQVVSDSNHCLGRQCPNFENKCHYQQAKRRNAQATILIVNHALLCADLSLKGAGINYLPEYRYLIVDEAHDLERYASDHLGIRVTEMGFNWTLSQVLNSRKNKGIIERFRIKGALDLFRQAKDYGERFFQSVENWAYGQSIKPARVYEPDTFNNEASEAMRALAMRLKEAVTDANNEEDKLEIEANVKRVNEYADSIDSFVKQSLDGQVYWIDIHTGSREQNTELRAAPVHVGHLMDQLMFDRCKSVILTSATLATAPDDFKYINGRLGVPDENSSSLQVGSPFDFKKLAEIVIPDLPEPPKGGGINEEYEGLMAEEVITAVKRSRGGTFALFTSYAQMRRISDSVRTKLELQGFTVLRQGDGISRPRMIERFKEGKKMVLFGVESFWQGVDVPGEALTTVILARIPFPVPSDPLIAARMEEVKKTGGNDFSGFMVPEATIKLRQGFGRLIRRKDDFGTVVILDTRIIKKGYGKKILRSLPEGKVTNGHGHRPSAEPQKKKTPANPFDL